MCLTCGIPFAPGLNADPSLKHTNINKCKSPIQSEFNVIIFLIFSQCGGEEGCANIFKLKTYQ